MILFKRRSDKKADLARKRVDTCRKERRCPACGSELKLSESGKDRDLFLCEKCNSTVTFTNAPFAEKDDPSVKKYGSFTLRDKSKDNRKNYKDDPQAVAPKDTIKAVQAGMREQYLVSFDYVDSGGVKSSRTVEPYKIIRRGADVILYGYDVESHGIRVFKLSRVNGLEKQPYQFKPRWPIEDKLKKNDNA